MTIFIAALAVITMLIGTFALLFWKLATRSDNQACTAEWFENFSVDSYALMERLLDRSDFEFLAGQPGYKPEIGVRLLKERKKLFLGYLRTLIADFNRLLRIARLMIVYSTQDRAEFAKILWREQVSFYFAVCAVRVRVALYPIAWTPVQVSNLVRALDQIRNQVAELGFQPISIGQSA